MIAKADGQKYNRSHEDASDADLKALTYVEKVKAKSPRKKQDDDSVEDKLAALAVTNQEAEPEAEAEAETEDPFQDVPVLSRTTAELYLFDTETDVFVIQEKEVDVDMASNGDFESTFKSSSLADDSLDNHPSQVDTVYLGPYRRRVESAIRHGKCGIHVYFPRKGGSASHDLVSTIRPDRLCLMERQFHHLHVGRQEQDVVRQSESR